ncbi:MAG: GntR family transcriptional regulator [Gemmatimonadetes bacterium]|nr:GntR family transcriptional regulator [Gemmatimonadota bacterium]
MKDGKQAVKGSARGDRVVETYTRLRELIVRGRLAPGTRIIETDVADRLGVSRTPVRSALQRLQQEGYIVTSSTGQRARPSVAPLTKEDATELLQIVGEMEALAARWCAELPTGERRDLVRDLRGLNQDLSDEAHSPRPDANRIFDLDDAFHRRYVEGGGGARLLGLHDAIKPQAERYIRVYVSALVDQIHTSVEEHAHIVAGIERGHADEAQRAVQTNWRNAAQRLSQVIDTVGERGSW